MVQADAPIIPLTYVRRDLRNNQLTSLQAGVFNGLTVSGSSLDLQNNQLTSLPPGVFNGLTVSGTL